MSMRRLISLGTMAAVVMSVAFVSVDSASAASSYASWRLKYMSPAQRARVLRQQRLEKMRLDAIKINGNEVQLNPQPLPPIDSFKKGSEVQLNPQPLPPIDSFKKGSEVQLNPQPLPPLPVINRISR